MHDLHLMTPLNEPLPRRPLAVVPFVTVERGARGDVTRYGSPGESCSDGAERDALKRLLRGMSDRLGILPPAQ